MFVPINNTDMNIFKVDEWINHTRDETEEKKLSPEQCMDILSMTNFYGHIKKVLKNIKEKNKTKEEVKQYEEFIIACVDCRKTSDVVLETLREMADFCGCRDRLEILNRKDKFYDVSDCKGCIIAKYEEDVHKCDLNNLKVCDKGYIDTSMFDYGKIAKKKYFEEAEFYIDSESNFPEVLDLSMYDIVYLGSCEFCDVSDIKFKDGAKVNLSSASYLPKGLDLSMCSSVVLSGCNLGSLSELKFRDGAEVDLIQAFNYPKDVDFSMCSNVYLSNCNLAKFNNLKFREGAKVNLSSTKNIPHDLDVSMCSSVDLSFCDLENVSGLRFREGSSVRFYDTKNFPKYLDVSSCARVDFTSADFCGVEELKFANDAKVSLGGAKNLPCKVDLSMCKTCVMDDCDLSEVEILIFKDKKQREDFMQYAINFSGKIVYVGDKNSNVMLYNNDGVEI